MSGIAIAIGAAAVVGAGAGIGGAMLQSSAAQRAAATGAAQIDIAQWNAQNNLNYLKSLYQPFITMGTNALGVLQSRVYSSADRAATNATQRTALQAKIEQLSKPTDWATFPIQVGEKASERRQALFMQVESDRQRQLDAAKSELALFDKQNVDNAPLYAAQDAEAQARMDRITSSLDRIHTLSDFPTSLADIRDELQNDPVYKFRREEGERAINRAAAAKGIFRSGRAVEELADFSLALTGEETDKYINRRVTALNAAVTGLGAELGEQGQSVGQALSLATLGANTAVGMGSAVTGQTAAQSQLSGQQAQIGMQSQLAQGQAMQQGLGTVGSMAGSLAALTMLSRGKADTTTAQYGSAGDQYARADPFTNVSGGRVATF